ncbi:MAG: hypothetical protein PWQ77_721 [Kosmotogales bacterium]|nr:hypothetical protein [Kosmotogales bacterium]
MNKNWDEILKKYVYKINSPDGRDTFGSSSELVRKIIDFSHFEPSDTVIDMGSGWGNLTINLSEEVLKVIGIEPNKKNIDEAKKRTEERGIYNIEYIKGSFEDFKCKTKVNAIVSSITFHQVNPENKRKALANVKKALNEGGRFILCDTLILFNPFSELEFFNSVYRYLLSRTTPDSIYEKYIKPNMEEDSYIYSWEDMKKYTPEKFWYYSLNELETIVDELEMKIEEIEKLSPFFGILKITNR